jgi:D-amino-acid dehydrogenase
MPIIGCTPADDRVIVATGHGVLGITLAPSTAELVATLAAGKELEPWLDALDPGRFRRLAGF